MKAPSFVLRTCGATLFASVFCLGATTAEAQGYSYSPNAIYYNFPANSVGGQSVYQAANFSGGYIFRFENPAGGALSGPNYGGVYSYGEVDPDGHLTGQQIVVNAFGPAPGAHDSNDSVVLSTADGGGGVDSSHQAYEISYGSPSSTYTVSLGGLTVHDTVVENDVSAANPSLNITLTLGGTYTSSAFVLLDADHINLTGSGTMTTAKLGVSGQVNVSGGTLHGDITGIGDVLPQIFGSITPLPGTTLTLTGSTAKLEAPTSLTIGVSNNGAATLALSNGAQATAGFLALGDGGQGTSGVLTAAGGAQLTTATTNIASSAQGTGTVTLSGAGTVWTSTGVLSVGYAGTGTLTVKGGAVINGADSFIGSFAGATGTATVQDAGSQWNHTGDLTVGDAAPGTLTIQGGGMVTNTNGFISGNSGAAGSSVTVTNAGSTWTNSGTLSVGDFDQGALTISDGGAVTTEQAFYVGNTANPHGQGTVTIQSGGTLNTATSLGVGDVGATLSGPAGSPGTVTVDGNGSDWTSHGEILVGSNGGGALTVSNGASVTSGAELSIGDTNTGADGGTLMILSGGKVTSGANLSAPALAGVVGFGSGTTGTVTIDGAGSTWDVQQRLNVGYSGTGAVTVQNGGTLQVEGDIIRVGRLAGSTGTLTFDGSGGNTPALNFTGGSESQLIIGDAGTGVFNVTNGAEISSDSQVIIGNQAAVAGTGGTGGLSHLHLGRHQRRLNAAGTSAGTGTAVVGTGASWNIGDDLVVGAGGVGTLTISGNASVTNQAAIVGRDAGSQGTVTVSDTGSIWHSNKDLTIGQSGTGSVTVQNSATLRVDGDLTIGTNANAVGTLTVDGANTSLVYGGGDVAIGSVGTGTFNVQNGALVNLSGTSVTLGDMAGGNGTLNVTGTGSTFHGGDLTVGGTGTGTVNVDTGGTLVSGSTTIGDENTATGTATVDGSVSSWTMSSLTVGGSGTGQLDIQNGGSVLVNNGGELTVGDEKSGDGTLTISDAGSALHYNGEANVGENGTGVLAVQGGATFTAFKMNVGDKGTGNGTLNVDGAGTRVEVQQDFNVGEQGIGTLSVTGGALLLNDSDATLADLTGSSGTATVDTSAVWTVGGSLSVGHQGIGGLQVSNGALVSAKNVTLGEIKGAGGTATVSGRDAHRPSTLRFDGTLKVGDAGHGELDVQNGGLVQPSGQGAGADAGSVEVASQAGSVGRISVDGSGSRFEAENLAVGGTNAAPGGAGTFVLTNGGTARVATSLHVWGSVNVQGGGFTLGSAADPAATGTLRINAGGTLAGSGTVIGNVVNAGGTVAPGDPRILTINGNYEQDAGAMLQIAIGGGGAADYDHLLVSGEVSLEGGSVLSLAFINGYAPQKGAIFNFLSFGSLDAANEAFSVVNITGLAPGFEYSLLPDPNDPSDYELLALNNGVAGVPEPRPVLLVLLGILAGLGWRNVRQPCPRQPLPEVARA